MAFPTQLKLLVQIRFLSIFNCVYFTWLFLFPLCMFTFDIPSLGVLNVIEELQSYVFRKKKKSYLKPGC